MSEHNPPVEIAVLGPLSVRVDGVAQPIRAPKQRVLIARLVADAGSVVPAHQLLDALWGEAPPPTAAKNLQVLVGRLRAVMGDGPITTVTGGYVLDPSACRVDVIEFERWSLEAVDRAKAGQADEAIELSTRALATWRGDIAAEFRAPWGVPSATRWHELRIANHERLLALRTATAPSRADVDEIRDLVERHPHRESLRVLLVEALRRGDDLPGARAALDDALLVLGRDLGLAPSSSLAALATEFGAHSHGTEPIDGAGAARLVDTIALPGRRFEVVDALAAARERGMDDVAVLDLLEIMVAGGDLVREVDDEGRVYLVRTSAAGTVEATS